VDWIDLAQNRHRWRTPVQAVMKLLAYQEGFCSMELVNFSTGKYGNTYRAVAMVKSYPKYLTCYNKVISDEECTVTSSLRTRSGKDGT
jgi:hypothetical protein